MSPKILEWLQNKSTSISETLSKKGSVTVYTPRKALKSWARFLPILNKSCSVPEDAEYTSTLLAQIIRNPPEIRASAWVRKKMTGFRKRRNNNDVSWRTRETAMIRATLLIHQPVPNHTTDEGE
jgi:hypothetical protein